jgi:hypothetical protein
MKLFLLAVVALCALAETEAKCATGFDGAPMTLCSSSPGWVKGGGGVIKGWEAIAATCVVTDVSNQECVKVPTAGGPFISGHSAAFYTCNVYARDDCRGKYVSVNKYGWFNFPRGEVKSFRCPCRRIPPGK